MKNKILYLMIFAAACLSMTSCKDETEGLTRITYYPELTIEGESTLILDKGSEYEEPGYSAILNGEDVTEQVKVTTNLDMDESGVYTVRYSIANADGFSSSATRTVIVLDPNDEIEGIYATDPVESYRDYNGIVPYQLSFDILVINRGNYYEVDDLLGGWYCQRAGYGSDYAMWGAIDIDEDGSIELLDSYVPGWGDEANYMADGKYDAGEKSLSWTVSYTDYPFDFVVKMYKK